MYIKPVIALVAATAVYAAPTAQVVRDDSQPWQITQLFTHTPSGRPGNDPHSTLTFTIIDRNVIPAANSTTFPATTATCSLQYLASESIPWGETQSCTSDDTSKEFSTWSFTLNKPEDGTASASTNFDLSIKLVDKADTVEKTFTGGDHFEVGGNMSGQCGGSGVCSWFLKNTPYDVQQTQA